MVVGQILSNKKLIELAGDSKEKDRYTMAQLGISKASSLDEAAKILGDLDPKFITAMNLAALIFSDWDDPISKKKKVHYQLKKLYSEERKSFLTEFGLELPYVEFLKRKVMGIELNCLKVREKYKNFEVSTEDILRNVDLPDLNYEVAVLLGIYRAKGILQFRGKSYILQLTGGKGDFSFYENYIKNALRKLHNLEVKVSPVRRKTEIAGKEYEPSYPQIGIGSKMICTWLKYDLGFPHFDKINWTQELRQGLFDGIVASMGELKKLGTMVLTEHNLEFVKEISLLSEKLGFTPFISLSPTKIGGKEATTYKVCFSQNEVKRMNLINPKHLRKLNKGG